jgi:superfamily II DNA or RNA helicase
MPCKLIVRDAVNVRFEGLELPIRKKLCDALKFKDPAARHKPTFKLGRWDGTISFCTQAGSTFLNLLDRVLPILDTEKIDIELVDQRKSYDFHFPIVTDEMFAHKNWPVGHILAGEPIMLRDYQVAAINTFIDNLQAVQTISTGAGKTLLTAALSSIIEPYGRSIIIVPSKTLVLQTEEDYRNIGLDVGVFYGDRKEFGHQHTICTWHSLSVFAKRSRRDAALPISIMEFIAGVVCVIIDETHTAKANELRNLLTGPFAAVPIRWGVTGTLPKMEHEAISILASIGPNVGELRAADLQERGVLANCDIKITQIIDDDVEFADYDSEHRYLVRDKARIGAIADMIQQWSASGNTLVLISQIETGKMLHKLLPDASFVYGETVSKKRVQEYNAIRTATSKTIIATYGVAAVGIDIPSNIQHRSD